ncbi:MAG: phosphoribosyltransferase family protein [Armatimonadota bacterium]|nr:phosphoribosyltransferase [bacterium]
MHTVFEDRAEAGRRLAKKLIQYHNTSALLLAIPRGGVPVVAAAARRLQLEWNIIVARKLPIPTNPEAGFGAVTTDGSVVLNDMMLHGLHLTRQQVDSVVDEQKKEAARRMQIYSRTRLPANVSDRTVIVIDDGLASGYTMLAAVKSLRDQSASKIVVAAPVASRSAAAQIQEAADECVFEIISPSVPFAVADFYLHWQDLTDDDVLALLKS